MLNRGFISVNGPAAASFLQGLVTNDINACIREKMGYGLLLNSQGRYLFDFFIYHIAEDEYILDTSYKMKSGLLAKLSMYKLRTAVVIKDVTEDYSAGYSRTASSSPEVVHQSSDCRYHRLGYRTLYKGRSQSAVSSSSLYLKDKYDFAIPDGESELEHALSLVPEYGIDRLGAICYDKGCYIGQEVIARTKYQGVVRKAIFKIIAADDLSAIMPETLIYADDQKIGKLCSSYGNLGIALIREQEHLTAEVEGISLKLQKAPWYES